ncbi:MAG: RHS repeat-associated core domain-containing protein [Candidatus Acidiferrales bacterium]
MRRSLIVGLLLFAVSFGPAAHAQVTSPPDITNKPIPGVGHDYIHMLSETVNPADGTVNLKIDLAVPPGRSISLPFAITYNSGSEYYVSSYQPGYLGTFLLQSPSYGGWGNSLPFVSFAASAIQYPSGPPGSPTGTCYFSVGYSFHDSSGAAHSLDMSAMGPPPSTYANCTDMGGKIPSFFPVNYGSDNQAYGVFTGLCTNPQQSVPYSCTPYGQPPLEVFDAAGAVYSFPASYVVYQNGSGPEAITWPTSIEDRNGNIIRINSGGNQVTDTADRSLVSLTYPGGSTVNPTGISAGGLAYTLGYANYPSTFSAPGPAEQLPPLGESTIPSGLTCGFQGTNGGSLSLLHTITLPNNKTYTFSYDSTYGLLNEIIYPDGGWVKYTWEMSPVYTQSAVYSGLEQSGYLLQNGCVYLYKTPVVQTRQVSFDGSTVALTQTFTYNASWNTNEGLTNQWLTKSTTVQTTDAVTGLTSQTIYNYSPVAIPPPSGFGGGGEIASQVPVEQEVQEYNWGNITTPIRQDVKQWFDQFNLQSDTTTIDNTSTSEVSYTYGFGGAVTQKQEYDFGSGAPGTLLRTTVNNYQTFPGDPLLPIQVQTSPSNLLTSPCQTIVYNGAVSPSNRVAETDYLYDGGTATCGTAGTPSVTGVSGLPSGTHDETYYGPSTTTPAPRGNVTSVTKQCFPSCPNPASTYTYTYDETGQVLTAKDPCGNAACADMTGTNHTTTYAYTDSYSSCGGAAPPSGNTNAFLTAVTNPLGQITKYCYGYTDGQLRGRTDENTQTTTYSYSDSLDRLTETQFPDGGQTKFAYNDSSYNPSTPSPNVTTTKKITSGQSLVSVTARDGMGHVIKTQTTDPQGTIYVITGYDGVGKTYTVTNPYRSHSDPTYGTTTYNYDALGRTTLVIPPDGTKTNNNVSTQYCGNSTLVTDQAAHWRRSKTDGLGRLVEVDEPNSLTATVNVCPGTGEPIWITTYSYDALNDLTKAVQGGSHTRTFIYDSLKRLTSSANPETGTTPVLYTYDANSNVSTKKDPRSIMITYGYEPLNRMTGRTYSNGDPSVSYTYDQTTCVVVSTCYNIGRRTSMTDADGSESWAYDTMGREWGEKRTTNSVTKTTGYTYNLAGGLATLTYPSGRIITYVADSVDRPSSAQDVANNISYIDGTCANGVSSLGVCYAPQAAITSANIGPTGGSTWLDLTMSYNTRLQPNEIQYSNQAGNLMSLQYNFVDANSHNNGNVIGITNSVDATRSQQFTYDQVNRLLTGETTSTHATSPAHCWGEAYVYDNAATGEYGNLTNINVASTAYNGCSQESGLSIISNTANQITAFSYDASGNVLNDTHNSYVWNAESEIKTAAGVTYTYDGDGDRVQKSNGKIYWYGAGAEILDESDSAGNITDEYVFFGGKRVAHRVVSGNVISYYGEDFLGTSRQIYTSASALCYDADFYPFGGERPYTNSCTQNYKFEGKERDTETNNDDFGARYYSSAFGRWTSPDWSAVPAPVPYANPNNPQTLNLYAMTRDNPETFADLDGHNYEVSNSDATYFEELNDFVRFVLSNQLPHCICGGGGPPGKKNSLDNAKKKITKWVGTHPKTVKAAIITLQVVTVASAFFDEGASLGALPEEEGLEAAAEAAETEATEGLEYSERVAARSAEEAGPNHNFPSSFDKEIIQNGEETVGSNGYTQYNLRGSVNGKEGTYEIGKQDGQIVHRFFRPDH